MIRLHTRILGFSLIELLVTIAVIGILTSIAAVAWGEVRANARDKQRMSDLKELQLAVELYYAENGEFPAMGCGAATEPLWVGPGPHPAAWGTQCDPDYIVGLTPNFIAQLPTDPISENTNNVGFLYSTNSNRTEYKIMVHDTVESLTVNSLDDEFARCSTEAIDTCTSGFCSTITSNTQQDTYAVSSEGAAVCW